MASGPRKRSGPTPDFIRLYAARLRESHDGDLHRERVAPAGQCKERTVAGAPELWRNSRAGKLVYWSEAAIVAARARDSWRQLKKRRNVGQGMREATGQRTVAPQRQSVNSSASLALIRHNTRTSSMLSNRTLSTSSSTGGWERDVSARATEASRTDSGIGAIATSRRISRSSTGRW